MNGAETLEQVKRALRHRCPEGAGDSALAALDGCILLTEKQAEAMRYWVEMSRIGGTIEKSMLAVLTPEESS